MTKYNLTVNYVGLLDEQIMTLNDTLQSMNKHIRPCRLIQIQMRLDNNSLVVSVWTSNEKARETIRRIECNEPTLQKSAHKAFHLLNLWMTEQMYNTVYKSILIE